MRTEPTDFLRRRLKEIVQPVRWHACPLNDRTNLSIIVDEIFIRSIFGHFGCVLMLRQMVLASNDSQVISSETLSRQTVSRRKASCSFT